ncbi:hypothetical protein B4N89_16485 [Embleya scabrispora]|uniref:DUF11 domain-containing protein n=1 Tax=Embleya scabrispora TaxID=159449 RepID=A0A1T3NZP5_9ACTN|nr:DUF11 domain-containing protein [Embleya scabrispora]OPC82318.1 hypothetical protein B4N89_16485 [Embleya scabrispora]
MMRAKTRAGRALAAVAIGATVAVGANTAAVGTAAATPAPRYRPHPVAPAHAGDSSADSYETWYTSSTKTWSGGSYTGPNGWTWWSSTRDFAPSVRTALDDAMADLRARLDGLRATLALPLQGSLTDPMSRFTGSPSVAPESTRSPLPILPAEPPVPPSSPIDPTAPPKLELRRAADPAQAKPGDRITHTVTVRNDGGTEANSAIVRNSLPAGVKSVESKPSQGEFDSATGVWKTGRIKPGAEVSLILVLTVPEGAAGSEMTARSSFVSAPGAEPVIRNACTDDATAACASTRVADSRTR